MPEQLYTMPQRWADAWTSTDSKAWVDLYSTEASYTDHAFRIVRTGHEKLEKHHQIWRTSNPDFVMSLNPESPPWWRDVNEQEGNAHCSFRTINRGTFKEDLPSKKASQRKFEFSGVIDLVIEKGLIVKVDEWYTYEFDLSVPVAQYRTT